MTKRLLTFEQFAGLDEAHQRDSENAIANAVLESAEMLGENDGDRLVRYVLSTPAVGRDKHTVAPDAWQVENFLRNPVFLWAHDDTLPPIGRVVALEADGRVLRGTVEYAPAEMNPFAETIFRLVKGKYLNAVSASWQPLEWSFSRDKTRSGGIDFTKVDLLEVSQVPIPALPSALAEARSHGIDTGPIYNWAERLLDGGGKVLVPRDELETLRRAAKMPAAKTPTSSDKARAALKAKQERAIKRAPSVPLFARGLYDVANLAYMLESLGYSHSAAEFEAAIEGDESPVPAMIGEAVKALGEALIAMSEEEVTELLEQIEGEDEEEQEEALEVETRFLSAETREHIKAGSSIRVRAWRAYVALSRAGKLSDESADKLEEADGHHERALKHHKSLAEHHDAVSDHLKEARAAHGEAQESHDAVGEHLQAAQDEPEKASDHVKRAIKEHKGGAEHLAKVNERHADIADRHEDVGDSHRAAKRCVQSAQRCVRSVTQEGVEESEPDSEEADEQEKEEAAKKERRQRLARAHQLRSQQPE